MNNAKLVSDYVKLSLDTPKDHSEVYREMEGKFIKIIEALQEIHTSAAWSTLKIQLFDGLSSNLEKKLLSESTSEHPDTNKLSHLAGQLLWAESYADLQKLEHSFRTQLATIRKKLYGTSEKE